MRTTAIVNPRSANGRTGRAWPALERRLAAAVGVLTVVHTTAPRDAGRLAAAAVADGAEQVVAVGGDGTLSEVLDGLYPAGTPRGADVVVGYVPSGTGGDFQRSLLGGGGRGAALAALTAGRTRRIDLGRLSFVGHDGRPATRTFHNIASFGLSGRVDERVNRSRYAKRLGGRFAFLYHSAAALLTHRNTRVRITVDDDDPQELPVALACVCNGQYAGGGMHFAPDAQLDDGVLDLVVIGDASRAELVASMPRLYRGTHLDHPKVHWQRGRRITATAVDGDEVWLDVDGEAPGRLPATFEVLPGAVTISA